MQVGSSLCDFYLYIYIRSLDRIQVDGRETNRAKSVRRNKIASRESNFFWAQNVAP